MLGFGEHDSITVVNIFSRLNYQWFLNNLNTSILNPTFTAFLSHVKSTAAHRDSCPGQIPSLGARKMRRGACRSQQETAQAEAQKLKAVEVIAGFRDPGKAAGIAGFPLLS